MEKYLGWTEVIAEMMERKMPDGFGAIPASQARVQIPARLLSHVIWKYFKHLEPLSHFETNWKHLGPFNTIWYDLRTIETIWNNLGPIWTILDGNTDTEPSLSPAVEEVLDPETDSLVPERTYGCLPAEEQGLLQVGPATLPTA